MEHVDRMRNDGHNMGNLLRILDVHRNFCIDFEEFINKLPLLREM